MYNHGKASKILYEPTGSMQQGHSLRFTKLRGWWESELVSRHAAPNVNQLYRNPSTQVAREEDGSESWDSAHQRIAPWA